MNESLSHHDANSKKHCLAIGLCTYKRPDLLLSCLESIEAAEKPKGIELILLIADNDSKESGRETVNSFTLKSRIKIDYDVENGRGIPFARNNVMKRSLSIGVTELVFIDDDERVSPSWLVRLWDYYLESRADVVRGFVKTEYTADTPSWIVRGNYYQRKDHKTGTRFESASTNNVLFNFSKIVQKQNFWFDESFGLRGGSDSEFFSRVYKSGAIIEWVSGAEVTEVLETERFSLGYFLKRKFRTRNAASHFSGFGPLQWLKSFIRAVWKILAGIILLPFSPIFGSHVSVRNLSRIVEGMGRLLGLFGIHIGWDEYHGK